MAASSETSELQSLDEESVERRNTSVNISQVPGSCWKGCLRGRRPRGLEKKVSKELRQREELIEELKSQLSESIRPIQPKNRHIGSNRIYAFLERESTAAVIEDFGTNVSKERLGEMLPFAIIILLQEEVLDLIAQYIDKGGRLSHLKDKDNEPLIHLAIRKRYSFVVEILLRYGCDVLTPSVNNQTPLQAALQNKDDTIAAIILNQMDSQHVRQLILCTYDIHFDEYLNSSYEQFVLAVLDCLIEPALSMEGESVRVYLSILEKDNSSEENYKYKTVFQEMAEMENQNFLNHAAVRLLADKKWESFARTRFMVYAVFYLLSLVLLTFCVVTAVTTDDVTVYDTPLQYTRAVFEVMSYIIALRQLVVEIMQLISERRTYFRDAFNLVEMASSIMVLCVLPARYIHLGTHWYMFSLAYFLWVLLLFKYAVVFREIGAYVQILRKLICKDVVQFGILFLIINVAFSGSFLLALKGDSNLNVHNETSSFWGIIFIGVRTMIEAQPVVEYTGTEGYMPVSTIIMLVFLFIIIVILLNILIAQLTNTYQTVKNEAKRSVQANLAWFIARIEQDQWSCFFDRFFKKKGEELSNTDDRPIFLRSHDLDKMGDLKNDMFDIIKRRKNRGTSYLF